MSPDVDGGRPAMTTETRGPDNRLLEAVFLVGALIGAWVVAVLFGSAPRETTDTASTELRDRGHDLVAGHGGWNPTEGCWEFTDVYWERGTPWDLEWEDDDCFVSRVEVCLWTETSCYEREDDELVLRERSRESDRCYVLAERYCKDALVEAWTEDAERTEPLREEWDVEDEYWREE